ncbi:hypothetical protein [Marinithermus hydrothermalis]|uniref:DUF5667 domain-containing protein n=1 Tax=Marinithermus hydrothermalis (strain DSM 14884 / JCM 11576 / T1) TaxID=869210 RepID=F2NKP9_MARHT|nr:hypothetical protein [Marinithermus hydrothermalis]AEB10812.1 hypothetical protein Marky_0048 [Marinithermus hydrothermalis DSM 14884]
MPKPKWLAATLAVLAVSFGLAAHDPLAEVRAALAQYLPAAYLEAPTPERIEHVQDPLQRGLLWLYYASEVLAELEAAHPDLETYQAALARAAEALEAAGSRSEEVVAIVDEATRRHLEVLEALLNRVPPEAQEALARAVEASSRGNAEATEAVARRGHPEPEEEDTPGSEEDHPTRPEPPEPPAPHRP